MEQKLLWLLKTSQITNTRKKLNDLLNAPDLMSEDGININDEKYSSVIYSYEKAKRTGCSIITYMDELYPECMRKLAMPPPVLYVRGSAEALRHSVYVGMVGSRKCDFYGMHTATRIAEEIAETGVGVVSGGAEGIDAASHAGAINSGAPTIAFFGSGLDVPYPKSNIALFRRIVASGGAVVSEFPFGEPPQKKNFPFRNRLIAAMSQTVIVVQAGARSGALITAEYADKMGKTVFAVPGNIDNPRSLGANALIHDGALPLLSSIDAIDELMLKCPDFFVKEHIKYKETKASAKKTEAAPLSDDVLNGLSEFETEIVNLIEEGKCTESEIEENISFDASRLMALLGVLELKGVLKKGFDKKYKIIPGGNN